MRYLIIFIFLTITHLAHAQEQLGLRTDNYSGIHGTLLNPSSNITNLSKLDINLFSFGFFGSTSYGFIENSNISRAIRLRDNFILRRDLENTNANSNRLIGEFSGGDKAKFLTMFANGMGPSFMVKVNDKHSLGLFTNARVALTTHDIPAVLNYNVFFETSFNEFLDINPLKVSGMVWGELGINYAAKIETYNGSIGIGANLKFVNAFEAGYLNLKTTTPAAQIPGDSLLFQSPNVSYGITTSNLEPDFENINTQGNGFGVAFDLGFTYVYEGNEDNYKWKIGASLLDLGQIELSRNAQEHTIRTDNLVEFPSAEFNNAATNQDRIDLLSTQGLGTPDSSLTSSNFRLGLPGALSLQGDYLFTPNLFVHALFVQRIPMGENSLRRNNLLAVTPRYQHKWYGGALPISLVNYQKLSIGAAFRLAFLTIGSDDIGSIITKGNLDSTDFYIALKINPLDWGLNIGNGGRGKKGVKCYSF